MYNRGFLFPNHFNNLSFDNAIRSIMLQQHTYRINYSPYLQNFFKALGESSQKVSFLTRKVPQKCAKPGLTACLWPGKIKWPSHCKKNKDTFIKHCIRRQVSSTIDIDASIVFRDSGHEVCTDMAALLKQRSSQTDLLL